MTGKYAVVSRAMGKLLFSFIRNRLQRGGLTALKNQSLIKLNNNSPITRDTTERLEYKQKCSKMRTPPVKITSTGEMEQRFR